MTVISRFKSTFQGAINITGNVLGLAGDINGEGLLNFTVANPPSPPSGTTTTTWQNNASSAILNLPADSTVLYAEVSWSALFNNTILSSLGTTVTFQTPLSSNLITPDPVTSQQLTTGVGNFYSRSRIVTDLVNAAGSGIYTLRGVPSIISGGNNYAGWCLIVAYYNTNLKYKNISAWTMLENVSGGGGNVDVTISNFTTPPMGNVSGRIVVSAGGGNSHIGGDFLQFGLNTSTLSSLTGPNNPITNFFCSQINNGDSVSASVGQLDKTGTFGSFNSTPPSKAATGDRNSFDITNVNASSGLTNNQTTGVIRFGTASDTYQPIALGIQVDVNAPFFTPILKTVNTNFTGINDVVTYTVTFTNRGSAEAINTVFYDTIPTGTTFVPNSLTVNGLPSSIIPAPPTGVFLSTIPINQTTTISFKVLVNTVPTPNPFENTSYITYDFIPGVGEPPLSATADSNIVQTFVNHVDSTESKAVDKTIADVGSTLTYTIVVNNLGTVTSNSIIFSDTIPKDTTFVINSLTANGITQTGLFVSPPGATIPVAIAPNGRATITFKVKVNTIPSPNPIPNTSTAIVRYVVDPTLGNIRTSPSNSNFAFTQIYNATLAGITKSVDKANADCGDIITYTILIPNSGNVTAQNIVFTDTIPNNTTFITDSVTVNGLGKSGISPSTGITVPNLAPQSTASITFKVKIICS